MRHNHFFHINSKYLNRSVKCRYLSTKLPFFVNPVTIVFNDGQDLPLFNLGALLQNLEVRYPGHPIQLIGIDAGDRINEYGTIIRADYKNRGHKAPRHREFLLNEFLPYVKKNYQMSSEPSMNAYVGFSLGGLSAFDFTVQHPEIFQVSGVFSGSFWWRHEPFTETNPDAHRIMHEFVEDHSLDTTQRFWFQAGTADEISDRNHNGVIDSIDDTLHLMEILEKKGIRSKKSLHYFEVKHGTHDPYTWRKALPSFIEWYISA